GSLPHSHTEGGRAMNAMTARGLSLAAVVAVWTAISEMARVNLSLWPVLVGLACGVAAGGGVPGLQRTLAGTISGVVWALVAHAADPTAAQRARQAVRLLERALGEIRNFIGAFRPPGFERRELGQIIEGLAVQHETMTEQAVELELPGELGDCALPTKIAIYRILQEALANG